MSTATPNPLPAAGASQTGVSLPRVVRSEWTKVWSLRSTRWALLISVIAMAGLGIVISAVQMAHWTHMRPHERATFDPVDVSLGGVRIFSDEGGRYLLRASLGDMVSRWSAHGFVRVHRRYVVNLRRAVEVRPRLNGTAALVLSDGSEVPVARRNLPDLLRRLRV